MYEALNGDAHSLLQRVQNNESVDEVILVKATRGDNVIVPPNLGRVTINPSKRTLKMASRVYRSFDRSTSPHAALHGGAYYEFVNGRLLQRSVTRGSLRKNCKMFGGKWTNARPIEGMRSSR